LEDRTSLGLVLGVGFVLLLEQLTPFATRHVTEVICNGNLDERYNCKQVDRAGSDLEFRINSITQKVQLSVLRNDGGMLNSRQVLNCWVVDYDNWECVTEPAEGIKRVYSMWHGQYYYSLTGGWSPNYYHSGLTGIPYWLYRYGAFDLKTATTWQR
jgi:hypothetical protein